MVHIHNKHGDYRLKPFSGLPSSWWGQHKPKFKYKLDTPNPKIRNLKFEIL